MVDEAGGALGVDGVVLAVEDGDVGAEDGELLLGATVGVLDADADAGADADAAADDAADDGGAATPPCTVTRIPPGWKVMCATHCPLGAAEVAVAVTARLAPGASVPER